MSAFAQSVQAESSVQLKFVSDLLKTTKIILKQEQITARHRIDCVCMCKLYVCVYNVCECILCVCVYLVYVYMAKH